MVKLEISSILLHNSSLNQSFGMLELLSAYRPIVDLRSDALLAARVQRLDEIWRVRFGLNETICRGITGTSCVGSEYLAEDRALIEELVVQLASYVPPYRDWEYCLERGRRTPGWHFDSRPQSIIHFLDAARTDIYCGSTPSQGFEPPSESVYSVPSNILFQVLPQDYHQRGMVEDPTLIRPSVIFTH